MDKTFFVLVFSVAVFIIAITLLLIFQFGEQSQEETKIKSMDCKQLTNSILFGTIKYSESKDIARDQFIGKCAKQ